MKLFLAFLAIIVCCSAQAGAYKQLNTSQIQGSHPVQALIQDGENRVISLGKAKKQFQDNDFSVTKVNSVYQQPVAGGSNYKLDVNYTNNANQAIEAVFQGFFNTTSNKVKIVSLTYKVQNPPTTSANSNSTTTTKTTTTTPKNNTMVSVNVADLQTNQLLNALFNFGFNTTIANSINNGTIPNENYMVKNVTSISEQPVKNGGVYTFHVLANNTSNQTVALAFIVRNQLEGYAARVA